MRKWLINSPLWSTFLAKLARSEEVAGLLIFLIQKCSKVKRFLLTSSKFFLHGDFMSVFPLLDCESDHDFW